MAYPIVGLSVDFPPDEFLEEVFDGAEAFKHAFFEKFGRSLREAGIKLTLSPSVAPTPCACCRLVETWPWDSHGFHVALLARVPIDPDVGHVPPS